MCDCAEELERQLRLKAAYGELWSEDEGEGRGEEKRKRGAGRGAAGGDGWPARCGWTGLLGGALVFFSIFGFFYKYLELGATWRVGKRAVWKAFMDATCGGDATTHAHRSGAGAGGFCDTRLHDSKRRHPAETKEPFQMKNLRVPGFGSDCPD